ncbi:putative pyridoxal-phosphate dependent protein F13B12.4 [Arthrobacter sp. Hiyo4]|nr:putative pyridoxal-phosphate dependent protein F13B12.4 [Arthrobacter sp. Hiyo4]
MKNANADRAWADEAIRRVNAENNRSADTHLYSVPLPQHWGVQLYLKDESTHRSGSLKHRLARSLFLFGLVNGWIREGTTIVEASSGSTAVSEAYFAQLLGLPFVAVMTRTTSPEKISLIEQFGGSCLLVDHASEVYAAAADVAATSNGHYMDQFTYAERATDWRGNNNIAESIFGQLALEKHPVPRWIVVGAGQAAPARPSAATSATEATTHALRWWTRRIPRFTPAGWAARVGPAPVCRHGSKASAVRGWNRALCPPSSTT